MPYFDWNRHPCEPTSHTTRLISRDCVSCDKTLSLIFFWTCSKRYDGLRFSAIFRIETDGIAEGLTRTIRFRYDVGVLEAIACRRNGLPCEDPGFNSRSERCIYRASRPSQGTVNRGVVSKITTNKQNRVVWDQPKNHEFKKRAGRQIRVALCTLYLADIFSKGILRICVGDGDVCHGQLLAVVGGGRAGQQQVQHVQHVSVRRALPRRDALLVVVPNL